MLTQAQRDQLSARPNAALPPALAFDLWRDSGLIRVVEPVPKRSTTNKTEWRLTPEILNFLADLKPSGRVDGDWATKHPDQLSNHSN